MLVSKTLKFALPPTQTPNVNRWNIGCVGSPMQNSRVDPVDFMLFVSLSLELGSQHEHNFQWNMGCRVYYIQFFLCFLTCRSIVITHNGHATLSS